MQSKKTSNDQELMFEPDMFCIQHIVSNSTNQMTWLYTSIDSYACKIGLKYYEIISLWIKMIAIS